MGQNQGLGWLLDDLTERVEHVRHALVLSNDGLVTGASTGLRREGDDETAFAHAQTVQRGRFTYIGRIPELSV